MLRLCAIAKLYIYPSDVLSFHPLGLPRKEFSEPRLGRPYDRDGRRHLTRIKPHGPAIPITLELRLAPRSRYLAAGNRTRRLPHSIQHPVADWEDTTAMTNILLNMLGAATAAILLGTFHAVWLEWKREKLAAAYDESHGAYEQRQTQRFVGDLLKAEMSDKQRNVVRRLESDAAEERDGDGGANQSSGRGARLAPPFSATSLCGPRRVNRPDAAQQTSGHMVRPVNAANVSSFAKRPSMNCMLHATGVRFATGGGSKIRLTRRLPHRGHIMRSRSPDSGILQPRVEANVSRLSSA